ncbi:Glutamine synthetase catalytic domain [Carpediemonas membranifera]|uniref:Lengsin n=1 Tax=Carpediemonas membranifera TaxID=201153 RepID=A0A8J6AWB8_9EUKA|nr:Glutamine synthetase catalytic domain [Carpediemonas membranifera]|eukprot:KAG9393210.1 Glutamine synthetase catalytic domain [Carpediemonas membranifera]
MSILSQMSLFCVDPTKGEASVRRTLLTNPAVRFVSFVGVDVIGNSTDTLVPIEVFLSDLHDVFDGKSTLQTDGSSVVLTGLADLDDAQVDMHVDTTVKWYVQYNLNKSKLTDEIVGTLRVPCYLIHNGVFVGSRSRLRDSVAAANQQILPLLAQNPEYFGVPAGSTVVSDSVTVTVGTELEVWVATPDLKANIPDMDITQKLQKNYWARLRGPVRNAMEDLLQLMTRYGLSPEMAHKEVGGAAPHLTVSGAAQCFEQVEIDWLFADAMQAVDNELFVSALVEDIFAMHGLITNFHAKPLTGLAGNGEHHHVGFAVKVRDPDGLVHWSSIMHPTSDKHFLSAFGYATAIGIIEHYNHFIAPFVASTTDALRRLKPGFEAPVSAAVSFGSDPAVASRNRTVLLGRIFAGPDHPAQTRFELRSPCPLSNSFLVVASFIAATLDSLQTHKHMSAEELLAILNEPAGETHKQYRCETSIFDMSEADRDLRFGRAPGTVWEVLAPLDTMESRKICPDIFPEWFIDCFKKSSLAIWRLETIRDIREIRGKVRKLRQADGVDNDTDNAQWMMIDDLRKELAAESNESTSLLTRLHNAVKNEEDSDGHELLIAISDKYSALKGLHQVYMDNVFV